MPVEPSFIVTVPRQAFTGWFLAMRGYKETGLSDVVLTFSQGKLQLRAFCGETTMVYHGNFTGRVKITAQRMLMLAKKGEKMLSQPVPVTLMLYQERKRLGVDLFEVPAHIEWIKEAEEPKALKAHSATAVGLIMPAGDLLRLIKQASPGRTGKKDTVKFIASVAGLTVQTAKGIAKQDLSIVGAGCWTVSLDVMVKALQSYSHSTQLTIEAESGRMRMNSFHLPVLAWECV
jgi:hypothetical protein